MNESGSAKAGAAAATCEAPLDIRRSADVRFSSEPAVERHGGGCRIAFAVSAPTDVEVAVLDGKGKVVRHLAAGLLGPNAPEPFCKGTLKQELAWDGKDDLGSQVLLPPSTINPPPSYRVRVRLGSSPKLEKIAGWDGNTFGRAISSLAVGPGGEVFVLISHTYRGRSEVRVLDKNGKYLRTIMPYPASTPSERARSLGLLTVDGQPQPVVYHHQSLNFAPLTSGMRRQSMVFSAAGYLVMVSPTGSVFDNGGPRHLLALHPEGGAPPDMDFVGPKLLRPVGLRFSSGSGWEACFDHVAASPDGSWVYLTMSDARSPHCVFRLDVRPWKRKGPKESWIGEIQTPGTEEGFAGVVNRPGTGEKYLNDPQGLAVDAQGNLYVCDRGNDRVVVCSPEGSRLAEFPVFSPEQIGVHRMTGEIYVLSRDRGPTRDKRDFSEMDMSDYQAWLAREKERQDKAGPPKPTRLVKFSALGKGDIRELAAVEAPLDLMALDPESSPAAVWASTTSLRPGLTKSEYLYFPEGPTRGELLCVTDRGGKLEVGAPVSNEKGLRYPWFIAADPERNRVYIREDSPHPGYPGNIAQRKDYTTIQSLDLNSGELKPFVNAAEAVTGPDGTVYAIGTPAHLGGTAIERFDPAGRPSPWPGTETNVLKTGVFSVLGNSRVGARGFTIAPNGDLYLLRSAKGRSEKGTYNRVDVHGPDGRLKKAALVDGMDPGSSGIGVDARGNIYLGANVKPADRPYPPEFMGKVPAFMWTAWGGGCRPDSLPRPWYFSSANQYLFAWGCLFKFGPEGGAFYGCAPAGYHRPGPDDSPLVSVDNAPPSAARYRSGCLARDVAVAGAKWRFPNVGLSPALDIYFGDGSCICTSSRLAVDEYGRTFAPDVFRSSVWMLDTSGNLISRIGRYGNADDRGPEVRFAWPSFVDEAAGKLYVCDPVNRRVTVVGFDWAAQKECPLP